MKFNTKNMVLSGLLVALSIVIAQFMPKLPFPPPFSATVGSHVPTFIAMYMNPVITVFTVIGSTIGFLGHPAGPVVATRAFSHIFFSLAGYYAYKKKMNIILIAVVTMVIHSFTECVVAYFFGYSAQAILVTVGLGTAIHHIIDFTLAWLIFMALKRSKVLG